MKLEIISKSGNGSGDRPPILLIHGAWHGAWCWQNNFLDYFSEQGWNSYAVSLRGHGRSEGRRGLRWISIADYVADVEQVVSSLASPPILIGHSMGGFVVQKYLEAHTAPAAVLLAPVPVSGTWRFNLRLIRRYPLVWLSANLLLWLYPLVGTPDRARELLFSEKISDTDLLKYFKRLQNESYRASLDMLFLNLPRPDRITTPMAVLGAENDRIFSVKEIQQTARAYYMTAKIFPNMAHDMMVDPDWETVAAWIADWAKALK